MPAHPPGTEPNEDPADERGERARSEARSGAADGPDAATGDPRVDAGIDHLQTAARELIGAARAFLDVVDDLVSDREKLVDVAAAVGSWADAAARGARHAGVDLGSLVDRVDLSSLSDLSDRLGGPSFRPRPAADPDAPGRQAPDPAGGSARATADGPASDPVRPPAARRRVQTIRVT